MPGLDTNVLVRWLVADDAAQTARVQTLFDSALAAGSALFVPVTVLLELEWVLRSRFGLAKADVLAAFNGLLEADELSLQFEASVEEALHLYRHSTADFTDCLHAGLCSGAEHAPLLSFDARAARLPTVQLMSR